jgi:hypothetical protein
LDKGSAINFPYPLTFEEIEDPFQHISINYNYTFNLRQSKNIKITLSEEGKVEYNTERSNFLVSILTPTTNKNFTTPNINQNKYGITNAIIFESSQNLSISDHPKEIREI